MEPGDPDAPTQLDTPALAETVASDPGPSSSSGTAPRAISTALPRLDDAGFAARYAQGRVLGRGGMGEVLVADDHRIGREVAVKVMRVESAGQPDATARFVREARLQGQLEHPAIVPVHDLGMAPGGTPYFTMKRLRGMTLAEILEGLARGDRELAAQHSRRKLLTHFASVCQALELAHARGVIHRDLKPHNIMLGDFGEVYLLDWGIAKVAGLADSGQRQAAAPGETAYGSVLGTPGYMPPEQVRGETDRVDARADVYALGCILYEILTYQPLHARTSVDEMLEATVRGADARASVRAPQREVPPELEAVCVRATASEPGERFPAVRDMRLELERYLDGDRDLAARRAAAAEHTAKAETAAARALADDDVHSRQDAIREAGRALALDPGQAAAGAVITRLLVTPPRRAPPEAEASFRADQDAASRREAHNAARAYVSLFLFAPVLLWMGVRDWGLMIAQGVLIAVLALSALRFARAPVLTSRAVYTNVVLNALMMASLSRLFGPFLLVPGMAVVTVLAFTNHTHLQRPAITIAIMSLSFLLPVALELTGVLEPTMRYGDNAIVVLPTLTDLPYPATLVALTATSLGLLLLSVYPMIRMREKRLTAERAMHLQSWQLRQLMPKDVSPS